MVEPIKPMRSIFSGFANGGRTPTMSTLRRSEFPQDKGFRVAWLGCYEGNDRSIGWLLEAAFKEINANLYPRK